MAVLFTAFLLLGLFSVMYCHLEGSAAFSRMVIARTDADSDACEAKWKHWRQLEGHIGWGILVLVCALSVILK
jgi:hypothetical protein